MKENIKIENKLKKLREEGSKLRREILENLSIENFKLFLKYDINEFKINLLENKIKKENIFIELKGGLKK